MKFWEAMKALDEGCTIRNRQSNSKYRIDVGENGPVLMVNVFGEHPGDWVDCYERFEMGFELEEMYQDYEIVSKDQANRTVYLCVGKKSSRAFFLTEDQITDDYTKVDGPFEVEE